MRGTEPEVQLGYDEDGRPRDLELGDIEPGDVVRVLFGRLAAVPLREACTRIDVAEVHEAGVVTGECVQEP